jgi:phosphatidylglycerol lysyltransferase
MGLVNLVSATTPALAGRLSLLRPVLPLEVRHGGRLAAALGGFALLVLAQSLWRRKRAAWLLTLVVLLVSAVGHLLKGLDWKEALLAIGLALPLLFLRSQFFARSDAPSIRRGLRILGIALLFTLAYGGIGFYLLDRHFHVHFGWDAALRQTVVMFVAFRDPGLQPITGFGRYFASSIYAVAAATLGYALLSLVRSVVVRQPATAEERARARAIVEAHGRSSLARFTLFEDKAYFFTPGGSVVAFAVEGRTGVALGDPIGPVADAPAAIAGFREFCTANDWQPAFYQILPDYLDHYRSEGFELLCVGHEAIVDLAGFTLAGGENRGLRSNVNRLKREGHRTELHPPPLADDLLVELRAVSDEWLAMMRGPEKRFSLGWFDDEYIRHCPVMVARTPEGAMSAFANIIPEYQIRESSIDLMRRRREVAGGTMDLLFVALFEWARQQGYETFNLGLSPLAGVGAGSHDPAVEKAIRFIYEHVNQFYRFQGLHAFKEKFHPRWSPRYLAYPGAAGLPIVAWAILRADSGDASLWRFLR